MDGRCRTTRNGITLVEVVISVAMLAMIILGSAMYRYYSALDARRAEVDLLANRAALLLLESWHGNYIGIFDPTTLSAGSVSVQTSASGPAVPDVSMTKLGSYKVTVNTGNNSSLNNVIFYATMSAKNAGGGLAVQVLNVTLKYSQRGMASASLANSEKTLSLTTYKY